MEKNCRICEYLNEPITTYCDDEDMFIGCWEDGRDCVILKEHSKHFKAPLLTRIKKGIDMHVGIGKTILPEKINGHIVIFVL